MTEFSLQGPIPSHVGIIMDGNGRWAKSKGFPRSKGHEEGMKSAKIAAKTASDYGIKVLSLYIFSTENWKRTQEEVSFLMFLIRNYLRKEFQFYKDNKIRIIHTGDMNGLPPEIQKELRSIMEETESFTGLKLNLAINYGGRDEILRAANRILSKSCSNPLTEKDIQNALDNPELPDTDLIIRTGGDQRISNFLLWQSAYAELYFTQKFWPDFSREDFDQALSEFQNRQRRFGGYNE
ncbi:MAG: di-trans,poly-cis-decaprenylcistransferase [Spirochaetes bacterium GWB1_48_6]|nr:MAG: di-trans,poly-cis-decaprenylcistransferase [Spirochaetes bacterium GWB1_48_6]